MPESAENGPRTAMSIPTADPANVSPPVGESLLFGPQGLRSGWRLGVYVAGYYLLRNVALFITGVISDSGRAFTLWVFLWSECLLLVAAVAPALWLSHMEHRRFDDYGLPRRSAFGKQFWIGTLWGFVAITCLLLTMRAAGVFHVEGLAMHGLRLVKFAAFWALLFLLVAFYEDFLFRGYSQFTLGNGVGFWPAAFLLSAVFGAIHLSNPGEHWTGALGAGSIGLFFCLTLRRTGNLWFAVGMHAAWDWAETFFYSVPNSGIIAPGHLMKTDFHGPTWLTGGSVGPEGSVLLFVLIAVMWVVFDRMYPVRQA